MDPVQHIPQQTKLLFAITHDAKKSAGTGPIRYTHILESFRRIDEAGTFCIPRKKISHRGSP